MGGEGAVWKKRWGPASILPPRQSPGPPAPRAEPASGRIRRLLRAGTNVLAQTLARPADGPPPRRRQDRGGRTPPDHSAQSCDPTQRPPRHPPSSSEPARCPAASRDFVGPASSPEVGHPTTSRHRCPAGAFGAVVRSDAAAAASSAILLRAGTLPGCAAGPLSAQLLAPTWDSPPRLDIAAAAIIRTARKVPSAGAVLRSNTATSGALVMASASGTARGDRSCTYITLSVVGVRWQHVSALSWSRALANFVRPRTIITRAVDGRASRDCAFAGVCLFCTLMCLNRSVCIFHPVCCWKQCLHFLKKVIWYCSDDSSTWR